jgi:HAD superfamily hydrolase (TIGR01509 family)
LSVKASVGVPESGSLGVKASQVAANPKVLLWDIDGTLIDTTILIVAALDHVYRTFLGRTLPPDEIRAIIGTPLYEQIRVLGPPEDFGADPEAMEAEFIRYYEANRDKERIIPEVVDTLIRGKMLGRPMALVTSKNRAEIANTLPRLGIAEYVDFIVSADDVSVPKPNPEGVLLALAALNAKPEEAVFIGDTVHDLRAGRAAGVRRCAVTWGAAPRALLLAEEPEIVCDDPLALSALLGLES